MTAGPFWLVPTLAELRAQVIPRDAGQLTALIAQAVDDLEQVVHNAPHDPLAAVHVPATIADALTPGDVPVTLLAGCAATFVWVRLLDDLMDDDERTILAQATTAETLIASHYLAAEAQRLFGEAAEHSGRPDIIVRHQRMLSSMGNGQLEDENPVDEATTPATVRAKIERKSASMHAEFAAMAALAVGASADQVRASHDLGFHLGMARQYVNDLRGLVADGSPDLQAGRATSVMAFAIDGLSEAERRSFVTTLHTAPHDQLRTLAPVERAIDEVRLIATLELAAARAAVTPLTTDARTNASVDALLEPIQRLLG